MVTHTSAKDTRYADHLRYQRSRGGQWGDKRIHCAQPCEQPRDGPYHSMTTRESGDTGAGN
jgi:hypothetical protein